ncbi:serine hydrolase domain-containing protein [Streptomyces sp. NRRL F-5123]|uniref:serine hydrolase domain-containing protein n=1 Tax=Streptomyces sp. NRRL F-5123 TaxID=1463856 RepID=UPI000AE049ED|nr:serine hydrolase domain-containing protein [Streptomyces sp. NRRL F-5123]
MTATLPPPTAETGTAPEVPLMQAALARVRAPDVVLAVSRAGRRTYASGGTGTGTATGPAGRREQLAYGLGSLTKTFTVLLLADLARAGALTLDDPLAAHLPAAGTDTGAGAGTGTYGAAADRITLRHLATHTSGLPRVPRDLLAPAILHPQTNGYAGYTRERLLAALAAARPRHAPGTRWHYSNLGIALLGPVLEHAGGAPYAELLARRVLRPLGLTGAALGPSADGAGVAAGAAGAATGHRGDGRTPMPAVDMAAFSPAGGLLATPADLLAYAEALLDPKAGALRDVQIPQLRRRTPRHRGEVHTLTWYQHPAPGGPLLFHAGATFGQQCFLGFHPATRTAVAGFATRHDRLTAIVGASYGLLHALTAL